MPATTSAATELIVRHGFLMVAASFGVLLEGGPEGLGSSDTQRLGVICGVWPCISAFGSAKPGWLGGLP